MKFKEFLKKIQSQPESTRKLILWAILIIFAFIFLFFWVNTTKNRLKNFQLEDVGLPDIKGEIGNFSNQNIKKEIELKIQENTPQLSEEELLELERILNEEKSASSVDLSDDVQKTEEEIKQQ